MDQRRDTEINSNGYENVVWHKHKIYHFCETSLGIKGRIHNINLRIPCDYRQKLKKSGLDFKESERNMEFRKMVTVTLCMRQQKRHWCIEQSYGLCERGRGWEDLGEWHWNM